MIKIRLKVILERIVDDICRHGCEEKDDREVANERRTYDVIEAIDKLAKHRPRFVMWHRQHRFFGASVSMQNDDWNRRCRKEQAITDGQRRKSEPIEHHGDTRPGHNTANRRERTDDIEQASSLTRIKRIPDGIPGNDVAQGWSRDQKSRIRLNIPRRRRPAKRFEDERHHGKKQQKTRIEPRRMDCSQKPIIDDGYRHECQT